MKTKNSKSLSILFEEIETIKLRGSEINKELSHLSIDAETLVSKTMDLVKKYAASGSIVDQNYLPMAASKPSTEGSKDMKSLKLRRKKRK
jgi:hypothetical protein